MIDGADHIAGEIWTFELDQMAETLRVLDQIEGYYDRPDDLYQRVIIECHLTAGEKRRAFTYWYAWELSEVSRIECSADGLVRWPRTAVP